MPWWAWVLIWLAAVLAALGVMVAIGLSLWRRAKALFGEAATASERLTALQEAVDTLEQRVNTDPAVFADPAALRRQVDRARKQREAERRRRARDRTRQFG